MSNQMIDLEEIREISEAKQVAGHRAMAVANLAMQLALFHVLLKAGLTTDEGFASLIDKFTEVAEQKLPPLPENLGELASRPLPDL